MVVPVARIAGALQIQAAPEVLSVIAALGRTEDLRFSPSGRLIAIAGYLKKLDCRSCSGHPQRGEREDDRC